MQHSCDALPPRSGARPAPIEGEFCGVSLSYSLLGRHRLRLTLIGKFCVCLPHSSLSCTGVAGYPPCLSHFIPDCLPTCLPDNGPLTVTIGFDICLPAWEAEGMEEGRQG